MLSSKSVKTFLASPSGKFLSNRVRLNRFVFSKRSLKSFKSKVTRRLTKRRVFISHFRAIRVAERSARKVFKTYNYYRWLFSQKFFLTKSKFIPFLSGVFPYKIFRQFLWGALEYSTNFINRAAPGFLSIFYKKYNSNIVPNALGLNSQIFLPLKAVKHENNISRFRTFLAYMRFSKRAFIADDFYPHAADGEFFSWRRLFWKKRLPVVYDEWGRVRYRRHSWIMLDRVWYRVSMGSRTWVSNVAFSLISGKPLMRKPVLMTNRFNFTKYLGFLRKLWLRLRFERYFFKKTGQRVYMWFHSIWSLYFKRQLRWRVFVRRAYARLLRFRRRKRRLAVKFRFGLFKVILRVLGFVGLISGSLHSFAHLACFLFKKNRAHLAVMKLLRGMISRLRSILGTIDVFYLAVSGRFRGGMRTLKKVYRVGRFLKLQLLTRRLEAVTTFAPTRWGIFGIQMWMHFKYSHKLKKSKRAYQLLLGPRIRLNQNA